jgi:tetratricopeptide (TPR) repeat protein
MLSSEPDSAYAFVIQAAAHEGMEDFEAAAEAFNQAIERDSENAQIYGLMAAAQFSIFNIEGVSANANRAIELDDSLAQVYRLRGFTFMVMGDPPAAIEDANHAIELDPTYFAYYILRGNAMRATGNPEAALEDFNRIIELNPHTSFGFALRAEILMNMGDFAAAASDMATTIELDTLENVEGEMLQAGTPTTVTMTFGRVIHLTLEAQAGQILSLSATSAEAGEVDPLILLVAPDGTPLIFNDDVIPFGDSLDSAIADFEVPSDGMYTLIVTHALGGSEGDVEVLVEIS